MKINENYWKENSEDKRTNHSSRTAEVRRQNAAAENSAAAKSRQTESPLKEDLKFAGILKSITDPPKLKQTDEDSSEQRRDDKKDRKRADHQKDSTEKSTEVERVERFNYSGSGNFGGGNFGAGGGIGQTQALSENFAARSILHIADLERMISVIRKQISAGGRREIQIELKRSILEGLKVKISTAETGQTAVEFLAGSEKIRSQIEDHSPELAEILRGRGINLQALTTTLDFANQNKTEFEGNSETVESFTSNKSVNGSQTNDPADENTFEHQRDNESNRYRA